MKRLLVIFVILVFAGVSVFAQSHLITGRVIDENNNPVRGTSVSVERSSRGTSADASGNFKLDVKIGDVLQVSDTNFTSVEASVGSKDEVTIMLKAKENVLQEVVVTALGQTSRKAKLGYSTSTFNSEAINRTADVNALDALAGKIIYEMNGVERTRFAEDEY